MNKPKVGQEFFCITQRGRNDPPVEGVATVTKVGRKFFTANVKEGNGYDFAHQFTIDDLRCVETWRAPELYESRQDWLDEKEANRLNAKVENFFRQLGRYRLTLDQARRINAIIDETKL